MGTRKAPWLDGKPYRGKKRPIKQIIKIWEATKDPYAFWNQIARENDVSYTCVKKIALKKTNAALIEKWEAGELDLSTISDCQVYL